MITRIRLAAAVLTFILGLAGVWLTNLGAQLTGAVIDRLMPMPTLDAPPDMDVALTELDADTYAVYDALLNDTYAAAKGHLLVIKAETDGYDWEEDAASRPHDGEGSASFAEFVRTGLPATEADTLDNYLNANRQSHLLIDLFRLRTEHTLITEAEMKALAGQRESWWMWTGFDDKYPHAAGLYGLSAVGFNRERTQALVYFWNACGGTCGDGSYVLLEKCDGTWRIVKRMGLWVS